MSSSSCDIALLELTLDIVNLLMTLIRLSSHIGKKATMAIAKMGGKKLQRET